MIGIAALINITQLQLKSNSTSFIELFIPVFLLSCPTHVLFVSSFWKCFFVLVTAAIYKRSLHHYVRYKIIFLHLQHLLSYYV